MAININDLTNGSEVEVDGGYEWQGSGIFDVLMEAVNGNIKTEYDNGRITGTEYATVYLGAIQVAISEATKVLMNKDLIDVQVINENKKGTLLDAQIAETLDATIRANTKLSDELLTTEKQRIQIDKDNLLKDDELLINAKRKAQLDAQTAEVLDATTRADTELEDRLSTTAKQRLQIDKQIEVENKQIEKITNDISIENSKLADELLTTEKQRNKLTKDIEIAERAMAEKEATGAKQRVLLDKQAAGEDAKLVLTNNQAGAFDDSRKQKAFEAAMNGWALAYSSGIGSLNVPTFINQQDIDSLFRAIVENRTFVSDGSGDSDDNSAGGDYEDD